jgi:hypothetical protein
VHLFPARLHRQPSCKTLKTPIFISEKKYLRGLLIVTTLASFVGCFVLVVRGVGQRYYERAGYKKRREMGDEWRAMIDGQIEPWRLRRPEVILKSGTCSFRHIEAPVSGETVG